MENYFIKDYIDYASEFTDTPSVFLKFGAYSAISAAVGSKVYFEFGDMKVYPNLWIILMAPSSLYRKSTAVGIPIRLLHAGNLDVILPNEFSHESLVEALSVKPQGLFIFSEFMSLATALEKDYMAGAKAFLTEMFDSRSYPYRRKTKGEELVIIDPCVSILAATTIDWFLEKLKEKDLYGGFLTRFIYVPYRNKKDKHYSFSKPANKEKRDALAFYLENVNKIQGEVKFTEDAMSVHDKWYEENCITDLERISGLMGSFLNRLQMYLLKLAVIEELCERLPTSGMIHVDGAAMQRAADSVNGLKKNIEFLCKEELTFDKYQEHRKKVLRTIANKEERGISRSSLLSDTRIPRRELEEILQTLEDEEKIKIQKEEPDGTAGRTKTSYFIKVSE